MVDAERNGAGQRGASAVRSRHLAAACAAVIASVTFGINMRDANPDQQYATAVARAAVVTGVGGASRTAVGSDLAHFAQSGSRRADAEAAVNASAPRTPSISSLAYGSGRGADTQGASESLPTLRPDAAVGGNPYAAYLIDEAAQRAAYSRRHPLKRWWPFVSLALYAGAIVPLWLLLGHIARRYNPAAR